MFSKRKEVKEHDKVLGDMFKLLMNSSYGKTCEKPHLDSHNFTEETRFKNEIYDESIESYNTLENG